MTTYVGEEYRISTVATDFDHETPLTPDEVQGVTVTIYKPDGTTDVVDAPLAYDEDEAFWFYLWDTAALSAGTYKAKVIVTGIGGKLNWEWKKIRLARDPVPTP